MWGVDCCSFIMNPSSQWLSIIGGVRRLAPMRGGEVDWERRGDGESAIGDESPLLDAGCVKGWLSSDLGLSLPVGPLPRGARLAGGRLRAARRQLFSSSSSLTRISRAWR